MHLDLEDIPTLWKKSKSSFFVRVLLLFATLKLGVRKEMNTKPHNNK